MCGLLGYVYRHSAPRPDLSVAVRALRHRGPDDEGTYVDDQGDWVCGLAHTRLSIVDLSLNGHQPMFSSTETSRGRYVIVFNGEVYNFRALRDELRALGHAFTSDTDTEVILAAYEQWGTASIARLRGMFAFAIWDREERSLLLARDRLGVKPLYVTGLATHDPRGIAFASELRSLMATGCAERRISRGGLATYLAFGSVAEPHSILEGVTTLEPGSFLEYRAGRVRTQRYWSIPLVVNRLAVREEAVERVSELFEDAVRLRLHADVPTGVFLSGGIDSAAVVAMASRSSSTPLRTFTVVLEEKGYDEGPSAAAVARSFGCKHHESRIPRGEIVGQMESALASLDQPSSDGVNTFIVSRAARASGLVVALSGIGADELFAGYGNFRRFAWARRVATHAQLDPRLRSALTRATAWSRLPQEARKLAMLMNAGSDSSATYSALRGMFVPEQVTRLLNHGGTYDVQSRPRLAEPVAAGLALGQIDAHCAYGALDLSNYLLNTIVRDTDSMSMANSLEVREPFLDHCLVEYVMSLPAAVKTRGQGNKPLLTSAVSRVPVDARVRAKMGFTLPFDPWLRGPLRAFARERLSESAVGSGGLLDAATVKSIEAAFYSGRRGVSWSRLWTLIVLSDWCARHGVSA